MIPAVAVCGLKNSGKTTLCVALIREWLRGGIRPGYLKRSAEEVRSPGRTDTGAVGALGVDTALWGRDGVRFEPSRAGQEEDWRSLAARLFPGVDLLLIEGGKGLTVPKVWVGAEDPPEAVRGIIARYDRTRPGDGRESFGSGMEPLLARRLAEMARREPARVFVSDREIPMKAFVGEFLRGGALGMLGSLKGGGGAEAEREVRIVLLPRGAGGEDRREGEVEG
jgi:molybdopterin-guanine dinucleotide biosynthesis protein B